MRNQLWRDEDGNNQNSHNLFVIGNGFDLVHGLPTKTDDFKKILSQKAVYDDGANALGLLECCDVDWSTWEESLGNLDLSPLEDEIIGPDYLSEHESDRDGGIEEMGTRLDSLTNGIKDSLLEMVQKAEDTECRQMIEPEFFAKHDDLIVNFNYTSTVELLYPMDDVKILHIHGSYQDKDSLIFGYRQPGEAIRERERQYAHGWEDPDAWQNDYYVNQQYAKLAEYGAVWKKEFQYDGLKSFLADCGPIENVIVLGHSMGVVDSTYMEQLEDSLQPFQWWVWQYEDEPDELALSSYSFKDKVSFFDAAMIEKE